MMFLRRLFGVPDNGQSSASQNASRQTSRVTLTRYFIRHQVLSSAHRWPYSLNKLGFRSRKPYSFVELGRQLC
jgi:hypothetical protein